MVYGDGSKTMIITATPSHRERKVGHLEIRMTYDRSNLLETHFSDCFLGMAILKQWGHLTTSTSQHLQEDQHQGFSQSSMGDATLEYHIIHSYFMGTNYIVSRCGLAFVYVSIPCYPIGILLCILYSPPISFGCVLKSSGNFPRNAVENRANDDSPWDLGVHCFQTKPNTHRGSQNGGSPKPQVSILK